MINRKLRSRVQRVRGTDVVLPKSYEVAPDGVQSLAQLEEKWGTVAGVAKSLAEGAPPPSPSIPSPSAAPEKEGDEQLTVRYPPAVEQEDAYNLVKFYTLERSLIYSILAATFTEKLEFPFLPDESASALHRTGAPASAHAPIHPACATYDHFAAEHLIISLSERRSVLLIGRSGTGKTTIVVQRMWLKFRERLEALSLIGAEDGEACADNAESSGLSEIGPRYLHQMFVTANPILRSSVAKSFKSLQSGFVAALGAERNGNAEVPTIVADEELTALEEVTKKSWPLFLRAHHWLRLLDGTIIDEECRFFSHEERLAAAATASGWHAEKGGLDEMPELFEDDEDDESEDEEDSRLSKGLRNAEGEGDAHAGDGAGVRARRQRRDEVTFETFENRLWPLMVGKGMPVAEDAKGGALTSVQASKDLMEKVRKFPLKASPVFREIVSYIKGSADALDSPGGRLSRQKYLSIGKKVAPSFEKVEEADASDLASASFSVGAARREQVYELFERYEAWKAAFGAFDVMDACFAIFTALRKQGGYVGPRVDEIYVDEVQDFTQAELRLFLEVCHDKNALFFTGDTCQTIARGVGFRFEELTTMFYHLGDAQKAELQARGQRLEDVPKATLVQVPEINKLTVNYRTHNGILGAASQIVQLLLDLFPHSVDALEKDVGHFDGPLPTLLTDTSKDDLSMLLFGSDPQYSQIEFGAHQVVLVRDQSAKANLPMELQSALALTIFEAKGLEFDDVFLFNFFADSPCDERTWRVITGMWEKLQSSREHGGERVDDHGGAQPSRRAQKHKETDLELKGGAPRPEAFDRQRHSLLNEELKMLYTAVTRARVKVVIYDVSEEKRRPMFHYLLSERLAKIFDTRETTRGLAASSTAEEWLRQARNLMRQQLFPLAAQCFQKGDDEHGMLEALAMHFYRPAASATTDGRPLDRLLRAARCFELAGHTHHAASCLKRAGENSLVVAAYRKLGRPVSVAKALATAADKAASRREAVELYTEAAAAWEEAGRPTQAMVIRLSHRELQQSGFDMLKDEHKESDRLRAAALPLLEARKLYDAALVVCQQLGLDNRVEDLARTSAFQHLRRGDKTAMFGAVKLSASPEWRIAFLRQHGERAQVVELMMAQGLIDEAHDEMLIGGEYALLQSTNAAATDTSSESAAHDDPSAVIWLSRAFQLAGVLRAKPADGAADLAHFLAHELCMVDGAPTWVDLTIVLVMDALREGSERASPRDSIEPHARQIQWVHQLVLAARRVVSATEHELRTMTDNFLRLRGSTKPLPRMPSWRWLCSRTNHDAKSPLISGSARLHRLVESAVLEAATSSLGAFPTLVRRVRQSYHMQDNAEGSRRKAHSCSLELSTNYMQTLWFELRVLVDARAVFSIAEAKGKLRGMHRQTRDTVSSLSKRQNILAAAGRVATALFPEADRAREAPDYVAALPYAMHPVARARLLREIRAAFHSSSSDSKQPLRECFSDWVGSIHSKSPPQPLRPLPLAALLQNMQHTSVMWHVNVLLCNEPAILKSKLETLQRMGQAKQLLYPVFNLAVAGGFVHVSMLLRVITMYESATNLQQACQAAFHYLECCVNICASGYQANVSFLCCAELIERSCCYSLALLSKWFGVSLWLPHSLADGLFVGREAPTMLKHQYTMKATVRLLSQTLKAADRLRLIVLPDERSGQGARQGRATPPRFGLQMLERTAVVMLTVMMNRARMRKYAGRALFSDQEADSLLLHPLRNLEQQLRSLEHFDLHTRERLHGLADGLRPCLRNPSDTHQIINGLQALLLALRHDELCVCSWPAPWTIGRSPYFAEYPLEEASNALLDGVGAARDQLGTSDPRDVCSAFDREPGWRGVSLQMIQDAMVKVEASRSPTSEKDRLNSGREGVMRLNLERLESPSVLKATMEFEAQIRANIEGFEAMNVLEVLWKGNKPKSFSDKKRLRRLASRDQWRGCCVAKLQRLAQYSVYLPLSRQDLVRGAQLGSFLALRDVIAVLRSGASEDELSDIASIIAIAPHLKERDVANPPRGGSSGSDTGAIRIAPGGGGEVVPQGEVMGEAAWVVAEEELARLEADALLAAQDGNALSSATASSNLATAADADADAAAADSDEDEEAGEEGIDGSGRVGDEDSGTESMYAGLEELEKKETSRQEHALNGQRRRARRAIDELKARKIQIFWRRRRAQQTGGGEGVDDAVAMYIDARLNRFRSVKVMQANKWCLFCGTEFEAGHFNAAHKSKIAQFNRYRTMVEDVAAPMLGRIDSVRAVLLAEDAADEKAETARFEALHELDRT